MNSNTNTGSQLDAPKKKDKLHYRRLDWWADSIALRYHTELIKMPVSGWAMQHLVRECRTEGIIRLYEKVGVDDAGDVRAITGFEFLHAKTGFSVGECHEFMDWMRESGHLRAWIGKQRFYLYSPIFKHGDLPQFVGSWAEIKP